MMGYSTQSKGYNIWDIESSKLIVSRDVIFNESSVNPLDVHVPTNTVEDSNVAAPGGERDNNVDNNIELSSDSYEEAEESENIENEDGENEFVDAQDNLAQQSSPPQQLGRSSRVRNQTGDWWKSNNLLASALVAREVPSSFKTATSPDNVAFWQPGIDREHECLLRNGTWDLVDYDPEMKVLPCKYVFKFKENKPKVRLVALGCRQSHGIDYKETFAPVVTLTTIRTILAIASHLDWELEQMDVVTVLLNGDLDEDVYMSIPEELSFDLSKNTVFKLRKSLYGLKQSPCQRYAKIHHFLVEELELQSTSNDPCLYVRHKASSILIITLYVYDLLIAWNSKSNIAIIENELSSILEMKNLGPANVMLGIEIRRDRTNCNLFISQSEYTKEKLDRFGMSSSKHLATPMDRPYS